MLSIIVPIYNSEKFLSECIESILDQTYKNFELLLINDGSTDHSLKICQDYQKKDCRIKVFTKENSGVSGTRNYGLNCAEGDFIAFCDSDDIMHKNAFEMLLKNLDEFKVDRVCGGYEYLFQDGHRLFCKERLKDGIYDRKKLLPIMIDDGTLSGFLFSGVNNSIFKKSIIEENNIRFNENLKYNEDSLFSFEYALNSKNLLSMQSVVLYAYRQHNMSATKKNNITGKYNGLHKSLETLNMQYNILNYDMQMKRRTVTEAFWNILDIAKEDSGFNAIKNIKSILKSNCIKENIKTLQPDSMNIYKKTFYLLMKYEMAMILYFTIKKLVPFFSKYLSR